MGICCHLTQFKIDFLAQNQTFRLHSYTGADIVKLEIISHRRKEHAISKLKLKGRKGHTLQHR